MELHTIRPAKGAVKSNTRRGRGQGSGKGGTSARGHKGAKSRSGSKQKRNFEGGQMPLQMRLPKRGFKNRNRVAYSPFNLARLEEISEKHQVTSITLEFMREHSFIRRNDLMKVLGDGEVGKALNVEANAASASAKQALEAAGGSLTIV
jgi:large subunit ribosomal protein L15